MHQTQQDGTVRSSCFVANDSYQDRNSAVGVGKGANSYKLVVPAVERIEREINDIRNGTWAQAKLNKAWGRRRQEG